MLQPFTRQLVEIIVEANLLGRCKSGKMVLAELEFDIAAVSDLQSALERADTGVREVLKRSGRSVVVRGLPSELTLFAFGRVAQALVEYDGGPEDVAALKGASLGI